MKSAFECFQHVAKCERQAFEAVTESGHIALLETAKHRRMLGEQAKATEAKEGSSPARHPVLMSLTLCCPQSDRLLNRVVRAAVKLFEESGECGIQMRAPTAVSESTGRSLRNAADFEPATLDW